MQIVQKHLIADHMSYSQVNMKMGLWEMCVLVNNSLGSGKQGE